MDPAEKQQIESAIAEALGLYGVAGQVVFLGKSVELHGSGPVVSIEVEHLGEQWGLLPADMRARKVGELARRLAEAARASGGKAAAVRQPGKGDGPQRVFVLPASGIALLMILGLAIWWVVKKGVGGSDTTTTDASSNPVATAPPVGASASPESDTEARERRARVCEAARRRIYAGASIGPFDVEGWEVELWLATAKGTKAPGENAALAQLVAGGKITATGDDSLASLPNGDVAIVQGFGAQNEALERGYKASIVRFSGRYVGAYLDVVSRPRFVALAEKIATATGAEVGALYGHCAHLAAHDLGAWFKGPDAPAASASLLVAMGLFAEIPAVKRDAYTTTGDKGAIDLLRLQTAKIDRSTLSSIVAGQGGAIGESASGVVITFPIGGPTRASAAARAIAHKLGIGTGPE